MKFFKEVIRSSDNSIFKVGDYVEGVGAGKYYIAAIYESDRHTSGICIIGFKNKEDLDRLLPEQADCGFNDLTKIEHV